MKSKNKSKNIKPSESVGRSSLVSKLSQLVVLFGVFSTLIVMYFMTNYLLDAKDRAFTQSSEQISHDVFSKLSFDLSIIKGFKGFYAASEYVSVDEFHAYAQFIFEDVDHIQAVLLLDYVSAENRITYERVRSEELQRSFEVTHYIAVEGVQKKSQVRAADQALYLPARYTVFNEDLGWDLEGVDMAQPQIEKLVSKAVETGEPVIAEAANNINGRFVIYNLVPVYYKDNTQDIVGLVAVLLSPEKLILEHDIPDGVKIEFYIEGDESRKVVGWENTNTPEASVLSVSEARSHHNYARGLYNFSLLVSKKLYLSVTDVTYLSFGFFLVTGFNVFIFLFVRSRANAIQSENDSQAKSNFLAVMSHEIRTPLNGVLGMAELLRGTPLEKSQKNYLNTIISSGKSLLNVINDILDFSKIEAGHLELERVNFSLEQLLAEISDIYRYASYRQGVSFSASMGPTVPAFVIGDPTRLRQILLNLLSNAFKFTEEGEVVLRVVCIECHDQDCKLQFSIHDTGIGISSAQQVKLFKPFKQADSSTSRNYGGTGLGLSICKQLAELMEGNIYLNSELGKGSDFIFEVVFKEGENTENTLTENVEGKRVLIVDDYDTARSILSEQAGHLGMEVISVSSAQKAWVIIKQHAVDYFDFIITDLDMPITDGLEFAQQLSQTVGVCDVPVVLFTATSDMPSRQALARSKVDYASGKPTSVAQFLAAFSQMAKPQEMAEINEEVLSEESVGLSILVAEDNPVNAQVIGGMLKKLGHHHSLCFNGEEAVSLYAKLHGGFDLVLMDCEMPVVDGFEATEAIREYEQTHKLVPTPIVALTAHAQLEVQQRCLASGMDYYVTKPLPIMGLKKLLSGYRHTAAEEESYD